MLKTVKGRAADIFAEDEDEEEAETKEAEAREAKVERRVEFKVWDIFYFLRT